MEQLKEYLQIKRNRLEQLAKNESGAITNSSISRIFEIDTIKEFLDASDEEKKKDIKDLQSAYNSYKEKINSGD